MRSWVERISRQKPRAVGGVCGQAVVTLGVCRPGLARQRESRPQAVHGPPLPSAVERAVYVRCDCSDLA